MTLKKRVKFGKYHYCPVYIIFSARPLQCILPKWWSLIISPRKANICHLSVKKGLNKEGQKCNFLYQSKTRFSILGSPNYLTIILFSHKIGKFPSDKKKLIATSFICRLNIENWSMHLDLFDFLLSRTRIMKHSVLGFRWVRVCQRRCSTMVAFLQHI